MYRLIVSKDGYGDYFTLQEAINAIPFDTEAEIVIKEGIYREKIFSDKKDLTIIGEGKVLITYSDGARELLADGKKRGTFRSFTAFFSGEKLRLENITIQNSAGSGKDVGQAVALYLDVDSAELLNVNLYGAQDTFFLAPLPENEREKNGFYGPRFKTERKRNKTIIEKGEIRGSVDFIFGGGDAVFKDVLITSIDEGYVAAPSGHKDWDGFVFENCIFSSPTSITEKVYLMRPWRDEGKAKFTCCSFGPHINKKLFSPWPGREDKAELSTFIVEDSKFI